MIISTLPCQMMMRFPNPRVSDNVTMLGYRTMIVFKYNLYHLFEMHETLKFSRPFTGSYALEL